MAYIVESKIKQFMHDNGKQITGCGMHAIEVKLVEFLSKICRTHNGGHKRVDAMLVNCLKGI